MIAKFYPEPILAACEVCCEVFLCDGSVYRKEAANMRQVVIICMKEGVWPSQAMMLLL